MTENLKRAYRKQAGTPFRHLAQAALNGPHSVKEGQSIVFDNNSICIRLVPPEEIAGPKVWSLFNPQAGEEDDDILKNRNVLDPEQARTIGPLGDLNAVHPTSVYKDFFCGDPSSVASILARSENTVMLIRDEETERVIGALVKGEARERHVTETLEGAEFEEEEPGPLEGVASAEEAFSAVAPGEQEGDAGVDADDEIEEPEHSEEPEQDKVPEGVALEEEATEAEPVSGANGLVLHVEAEGVRPTYVKNNFEQLARRLQQSGSTVHVVWGAGEIPSGYLTSYDGVKDQIEGLDQKIVVAGKLTGNFSKFRDREEIFIVKSGGEADLVYIPEEFSQVPVVLQPLQGKDVERSLGI